MLKGGKGCDTFIFKHGLVETRVLDFHAGHDKLDFGDFFGSAKAALAAAHDHSGSAVFDLPGGDHVTLKGVSASHLSVDDFL